MRIEAISSGTRTYNPYMEKLYNRIDEITHQDRYSKDPVIQSTVTEMRKLMSQVENLNGLGNNIDIQG
jgi:hypothetical protein